MHTSTPIDALQEIVDENKLISIKPQSQHIPGQSVDDEVEKTHEVGAVVAPLALRHRQQLWHHPQLWQLWHCQQLWHPPHRQPLRQLCHRQQLWRRL